MSLRHLLALPALLGPASQIGCTPDYAGLLRFEVNDGSTVLMGTDCASPCPGDDVAISAELEEHIAVDPEAVVELLQYQVEIALDDGRAGPAAHAGLLDVEISSSAPASFTVDLAALSQRLYLDGLLDGGSLSGTATLRFAGYAPDDSLLQVEVDVPLLIGQYDADQVNL